MSVYFVKNKLDLKQETHFITVCIKHLMDNFQLIKVQNDFGLNMSLIKLEIKERFSYVADMPS
jgi:hypothetical protein